MSTKTILITLFCALTLMINAQEFTFGLPLTARTSAAQQVAFTNIGGAGYQDIMMSGLDGEKVSWYQGYGDGGFYNQESIPLDDIGAHIFAEGDIDGDWQKDIIVLGIEDELLRFFKRLDLFTFAAEVEILQIPEVQQMELQDMNSDGHLDVVILNEDNLFYYPNAGDGSFEDPRPIVNGVNVSQFGFGDFNGDSQMDVAFVRQGQYIAWCAGLVIGGEAGYYSDEIYIDIDIPGAKGLFVDDVDQDGDPDLLATYSFTQIVQFHENVSNGGFVPHELFSLAGVEDIQSAHMDTDGYKDIVVSTENELFWYKKQGSTSTWSNPQLISTHFTSITDFDVKDVDNDARAEVIVGREGFGGLHYFENGTNGVEEGRAISAGVEGLSELALADMDGDGDKDLVSTSIDDDKLAWYENEGDGAKAPQQVISNQMEGAWGVVPVYNPEDSEEGLYVWTGDQFNADLKVVESENGNFAVNQTASFATIISSSPVDLEGDERSELLIGSAANSGSLLYLGELQDMQGPYIEIIATNASAIHSVTGADLSGNGIPEVIAHNASFGQLYVYSNIGGGSWDDGQIINTDEDMVFSFNSPIVTVDYDQDGDLDILINSNGLNDSKLYLLRQGENFTFSSEYLGISTPHDAILVAGDVEGDGDIDILTLANGTYDLRWFLNDGSGALTQSAAVHYLAATFIDIAQAVVDDADGDGDLDVYYETDEIYYAENTGLICPADVDRNGVVDISDFLILNSFYGTECPGFCPADIDGDGTVNIGDFIILNSAFGTSCF